MSQVVGASRPRLRQGRGDGRVAGGQEETDVHEPDHRRTVRRAEDKEEAGSDGSTPRETDGEALDDERG